MRSWQRWIPAALLVTGALLNGVLLARRVEAMPLRAPIGSIAPDLLGIRGRDTTVDDETRRVAGMTSYILRQYDGPVGRDFSVYVGYYDSQRQGKSIHSPKNCLPGSGWEPVEQGTVSLPTPLGPVVVNRYRVVNAGNTAIVYYWYQGRGRIAANEFRVKFDLLRDAALRGRTEEALVRIVVPVSKGDIAAADTLARQAAGPLAAAVDRVLPAW
jgi:EpsI family protein